jgi:hypothetical protein
LRFHHSNHNLPSPQGAVRKDEFRTHAIIVGKLKQVVVENSHALGVAALVCRAFMETGNAIKTASKIKVRYGDKEYA